MIKEIQLQSDNQFSALTPTNVQVWFWQAKQLQNLSPKNNEDSNITVANQLNNQTLPSTITQGEQSSPPCLASHQNKLKPGASWEIDNTFDTPLYFGESQEEGKLHISDGAVVYEIQARDKQALLEGKDVN